MAVAFLARDAEMVRIAEACRAARDGEARAIGIVGEAGIGKSALLDALAAAADGAGLLVLRGRAAEHESGVPFALAIDAFDDHVAELHPTRVASVGPDLEAVLPAAARSRAPAPATGGPAERFRYHRALRALIELLGRQRPLAVLLDDLHWADEASVDLIAYLLRRPPRVGFLLGFTLRPSEGAGRLLEIARRSPNWVELQLAPLPEEAARQLLPADLAPTVRDRVLHDAGGNPLFLLELARRADDTLPDRLVAGVRQELNDLDDQVRTFAWAAAVAGDPFDVDVAAAAADMDPAHAMGALDGVVVTDLVRTTDQPRAFMFRHPLVHRAVYDAAPPGWRLLAHGRAAAVLARRGAEPIVRAHHVEQFAQPGDDEARSLLRQAAMAAADTSPAAAVRWYRAALRLVPHDDTGERAQLLAPLANALTFAGRLEEGRAALAECIDLVPAGSDERAELIVAATLVDMLLLGTPAADRWLQIALDDLPGRFRAQAMRWRSALAIFRGDADAVTTWADRAARELDRGADPVAAAAVMCLKGMGRTLAGKPGGDLFDRAVAELSEVDDARLGRDADVTWSIGAALAIAERFADAVAVLERLMGDARATRQDQLVQHLHIMMAMVKQPLLDLDGGLEHAEAGEESARLLRLDHELALALCQRARLLAMKGNHAEAERAAVESDECFRVDKRIAVFKLHIAHNAVVRHGPDPERMLAVLQEVGGRDLERITHSSVSGLLLTSVQAALALDRVDDADRWGRRIAELAAGPDLPATSVRAARARAEVLLARGEQAAAAELATTAVGEAERHGLPQEELGARILTGRALLAADDEPGRKAGMDQLRRAGDDAARVGAIPERDAAARELRRAGVHVSTRTRRPGPGAETLTAREREVAELAAGGCSNKQVAAKLFISVKTVEANLSRVYSKLGVRSRTELANTFN